MPYITDLISVDVLQKIQDAFSNMVGMAAVITDLETGISTAQRSMHSQPVFAAAFSYYPRHPGR